MMIAYGHATAPTAWHLPGIHEVAFLLHTAVLVLMLDAMVAIVFYFHKRRARFASPPTSLPVRPALLSSTIISEVSTVATRICNSLREWLLYSYSTTFSRVSCAGRRQVQHKSNTILTPCLQCSDDTPLHECNTDGYSFHLCKLCLKCRGNITSDGGVFEITDNIAFHGFISTALLLLRSFGNGLYHASSDTGVIATTAMFALHPVHTVTVLAFLVSSSSICSACMQLVHTLSYPVFATVSQIVDMRKRSIQQNTYGKFIRRAKTVVMAALTALAIIATTSYRVTSSASTASASPAWPTLHRGLALQAVALAVWIFGALALMLKAASLCGSNTSFRRLTHFSAISALCTASYTVGAHSTTSRLAAHAVRRSTAARMVDINTTRATTNWSTAAPPAWPPTSSSSTLPYVTPFHPTAYALASTPLQTVILACNPDS